MNKQNAEFKYRISPGLYNSDNFVHYTQAQCIHQQFELLIHEASTQFVGMVYTDDVFERIVEFIANRLTDVLNLYGVYVDLPPDNLLVYIESEINGSIHIVLDHANLLLLLDYKWSMSPTDLLKIVQNPEPK